MNTNPFSSWSDFEASKDAMYAFASNPAVIGILTIVSAIIFIYWLYTTFSVPGQHEHDALGE
jgi:hypothetical protein